MTSLLIPLLVLSGSITVAAAIEIQDGTIVRDGTAYRGIGVNYYDAFVRTLEHPEDTSYREGFATLREQGIPFARLSVTAYWAKGLSQFQSDPEGYLKRLDGVVQSAEENGVGLVPSFFWAYWTVPDLVNEPVSAWGDSTSKTRSFMRDYTRAIVTRYHDSPAIWIWEFGNEFNLSADLPPSESVLPPVHPKQGTPTTRSLEHDLLSSEHVIDALKDFVATVRSIDSKRLITTGHAIPRPRAESLRLTRTWGSLDDRAEATRGLKLQHPDGLDMVSVHVYPDAIREERLDAGHHVNYQELFTLFSEAGKPVFLGEFGAFAGQADDITTNAQALDEFQTLLNAIIESRIPLAAAWNFNGAELTGIRRQPWNFDSTIRSEYLKAIVEANRKLVSRAGSPNPAD